MKLKRWTLPSERLFNSHHLGQSFSAEKCSRRALVACEPFQAPKQFHVNPSMRFQFCANWPYLKNKNKNNIKNIQAHSHPISSF